MQHRMMQVYSSLSLTTVAQGDSTPTGGLTSTHEASNASAACRVAGVE